MPTRARRGLDALLAQRGRRLRRIAPSRPALAEEWRWDWRDTVHGSWWPQGVELLRHRDRDLLLISWFKKRDGDEVLTRLSVLDPARGRYHHVLLLEPDGSPVAVHAGGIALLGAGGPAPELHVADTGRGRRVFRLAEIVPTPWWRIRAGGTAELTQAGTVAAVESGGRRMRHSFLAVDRGDPAAAEPGLSLGEYSLEADGRIALLDAAGTVQTELRPGIERMQGAVRLPRGWAVSASRHLDPGDLWLEHGGSWTRHAGALPPGPEDLAADRSGSRLYGLGEFPKTRTVYRIDVEALR